MRQQTFLKNNFNRISVEKVSKKNNQSKKLTREVSLWWDTEFYAVKMHKVHAKYCIMNKKLEDIRNMSLINLEKSTLCSHFLQCIGYTVKISLKYIERNQKIMILLRYWFIRQWLMPSWFQLALLIFFTNDTSIASKVLLPFKVGLTFKENTFLKEKRRTSLFDNLWAWIHFYERVLFFFEWSFTEQTILYWNAWTRKQINRREPTN